MVEHAELDAARLLQRLVIRGLHGYKDIEITFPKTARIVIAENGSGKTTVLSALSLLLNKDLYELRRLPFRGASDMIDEFKGQRLQSRFSG